MNKQPHGTWVGIPEESTLTSGPEYVALLVEWDEPMDLPIDEAIAEAADEAIAEAAAEAAAEPIVEEIAETQVTRKTLATRLDQLPVRTIAVAVGALGAIGLAAWGIHRLRAA